MDVALKIIQLVIALGILNVWVLRPGKSTAWRGGTARNMREEFEAYGLPDWFMRVIGVLKLLFAAALIVGLWIPSFTSPAAIGLALLMAGAIAMHVKIKDPLIKSLPAFSLFVLSALVAFF